MTRRCQVCRITLAPFNGTPYCASCRLEARNGTLAVELWLPIPGIKGWEISQFGAVRDKQTRHIRQHDTSHKYPRVSLAGQKHYVHDLLARTFIGTKPLGQVVRHRDDDPLHHHASNVEYGSHAENSADAVRNGRIKTTGTAPVEKGTP